MDLDNIEEKLRALKDKVGWSNKKIAEYIGVPLSTFDKYFYGIKKNPSGENRKKLQQAFQEFGLLEKKVNYNLPWNEMGEREWAKHTKVVLEVYELLIKRKEFNDYLKFKDHLPENKVKGVITTVPYGTNTFLEYGIEKAVKNSGVISDSGKVNLEFESLNKSLRLGFTLDRPLFRADLTIRDRVKEKEVYYRDDLDIRNVKSEIEHFLNTYEQ